MCLPSGENMGICACCTFQPLALMAMPVLVSSIFDVDCTSAATSPGADGNKKLIDGLGGGSKGYRGIFVIAIVCFVLGTVLVRQVKLPPRPR